MLHGWHKNGVIFQDTLFVKLTDYLFYVHILFKRLRYTHIIKLIKQ